MVSTQPKESISLLQRSIAFMSAHEQARKIAKALTQAEADMKSVLNNDRGWFKRAFTSDPGSLEQIQQRVAEHLDSIEPAPDDESGELDMLSMAGFKAGFEEGKFDVQAKLFAIDASIFVVEVIALEIALGPLGGAKLIVFAIGKGAKVVTTAASKGSELLAYTTTKGGQALVAAMKRLENLPIFIPGAAGSAGAFIKAGQVIKSISQYNTRLLETAMFTEARILGKTLTKKPAKTGHSSMRIFKYQGSTGYEILHYVESERTFILLEVDGSPRPKTWKPIRVRRVRPSKHEGFRASDSPCFSAACLVFRRSAVDGMFGRALPKDEWPGFLEGAFFWKNDIGVQVVYREHEGIGDIDGGERTS